MSYEPIKCKDCGTWWRAAEHKCPTIKVEKPDCKCGAHNKKEMPKPYPKSEPYNGFKCILCGAPADKYSMYCVNHRVEKWNKRKGEHGNGKDS